MRKSKTIKIDDKEIVVSELRVKDIRSLLEKAEKFSGADDIFSMLPLAVNIKPKEIEAYAPSELKIIYDAFEEVNSVFFNVVAKSGIAKMLKGSILKNLTDAFATSLQQDTE
jgi:hypothetical protein